MKLLNVILILCIALTAFGIANAQQTITAYSVIDIQATGATDLGITSYTATASTIKNPKTAAVGFPNGTPITINTTDCTHTPAKGGENGIVVTNGAAITLLFGSGATCSVKSVVVNTKAL